jgi:hypothetical protein
MRWRPSDISDGTPEHSAFVAYVGVESEEMVIELSRGSGRLQRRILELLEQSPERKRNRGELDEVLVGNEEFDPSNVLRAIKGLARKHHVGFDDRRRKKDSVVSLPSPPRPVSDHEVFAILRQIKDASAEAKR